MNIPKIPFVFFLAIFIFNTASALGWGEKSVIFENNKTGELKSTYQYLYRFDNEEFRDSLATYAIRDGVPNDKAFHNWTVVYYKHCDRDLCKTQGDSLKYASLNAGNMPHMEIGDLSRDEIANFLPLSKFIKYPVEFILFLATGFIYMRYVRKSKKRYAIIIKSFLSLIILGAATIVATLFISIFVRPILS